MITPHSRIGRNGHGGRRIVVGRGTYPPVSIVARVLTTLHWRLLRNWDRFAFLAKEIACTNMEFKDFLTDFLSKVAERIGILFLLG